MNEVLGDTNLMTYNGYVQLILDSIRTDLGVEFGVDPNTAFVRIPAMFFPADPNYPLPPDSSNWRTQALAYVPDMVNLTVLGTRLLIADPFGPKDANVDVFRQYVQNALSGSGLTLHFIDDWDAYHVSFGEVHCGTNVLRAPPTNVSWWDARTSCGSGSRMMFFPGLPLLGLVRLRRSWSCHRRKE